MKIKFWGVVTAALMCCMVLTACGGGGGGTSAGGGVADTMTATVSGVTTTYTEGTYNTQGFLDPDMSSFATTSNTFISLCSGVSSITCTTLVNISIRGNTPQSYPTGTTNSPTQITYSTNNQTYSSIYSSTIGTVTLSSVGNIGEKITGTFDAVVTNMSNSSDTLGISGTFSVERDH